MPSAMTTRTEKKNMEASTQEYDTCSKKGGGKKKDEHEKHKTCSHSHSWANIKYYPI